MAYIQQRGERKYKITVCNDYKPNGQKRMQARTITVPREVSKRGIRQYVMAEAERLEKRFRTGIDQSENTRFEDYANRWLDRMAKRYKVSTLEGYRRMLEAVYPTIGGLPLCKIRPMVLEELCEELRQRPGRNGKAMSENTVHKYLDTISAVLQDAVKNDILMYNPAHRVDKLRVERTPQRIPQAWEMQKLLQCILQEPLLYRVYYLLALSTGLRRGELCALRWRDLHGGNQLLIQHSRSTVVGKGVVESDTKSHRTRVVVLPQLVYDYLGELLFNQIVENNGIRPDDLIFAKNGKPVHPDTFSRHLRKLYDKNGFPKDYHLHTMRHFFATYLLENGTSKQVTADLLGHTDTAFLERTYCHPQDTCKEQAAGLLDSMLQPADAMAWEQEQQLLTARQEHQ